MLHWFGKFSARRPLVVVVFWLLALSAAGVAAFQGFGEGALFDRMSSEQPVDPNSESARADQLIKGDGAEKSAFIRLDGPWAASSAELQKELDSFSTANDQFTIVSPLTPPVEYLDEVKRQVTEEVTKTITEQVIADVPPWMPEKQADELVASTIADALPEALSTALEDAQTNYLENVPELGDLTSDDSAVILLEKTGDFTEDELSEIQKLSDELGEIDSGLSTSWSHADAVAEQLSEQSSKDLEHGEMISLPLALIVMLIIFGGFFAASMPLVGAIASILSGFATLWALSFSMAIDTTVLSVITVIGMGVSVDYGLLLVSRYREVFREIKPQNKEELSEVLGKTVNSAGRTIIFSSITIAIAVAGLLAFPIPFMHGIAVAASSVVLLSALAVVTLIPALLALFGLRIAKPSFLTKVPGFGFLVKRLGDVTPTEGFFSKIVRLISKAPAVWMIGSIVVLLGFGSSIVTLQVASSGTPYLVQEKGAYGFFEALEKDIPAFAPQSAQLIVESLSEVKKWTKYLDAENVEFSNAKDSYQINFHEEDPLELREIRDSEGLPGLITGPVAADHDFNQALLQGLPLAILIIVLATFVLLFLLTGSLFMPLKAIAYSALSLGASIGVLTWGFENSGLAWLFGFEPGSITGLSPIILVLSVVFGFGLAMDYEVFLISRIKEDRDKLISEANSRGEFLSRTRLNEIAKTAVLTGLQSTGRVITSAGIIIVLVFLGFTFGEMFMVKQIGIALAAAVLVDMIVVRTIAVPATLVLMGEAAWWAPKPLKKLHEKIGLSH